MGKQLLVAGIVVLLAVSAPAQRRRQPAHQQPSNVDELVAQRMAGTDTRSLVVVIIERGRVRYVKGYGSVSPTASIKPNENTVYYIGSLSKALTGFGAMMLVDKGKVSLNQPVDKYVPGLPAQWGRIPVMNYLT